MGGRVMVQSPHLAVTYTQLYVCCYAKTCRCISSMSCSVWRVCVCVCVWARWDEHTHISVVADEQDANRMKRKVNRCQ